LFSVAIPLIMEALPEVNYHVARGRQPDARDADADRNFEDALGYLIPSFLSFDMCTYPWYHSSGATNYNNVQDAEMDRMLEAQRAESDPDARNDTYPANHLRTAWHNYVLNYRAHAWIGSYGCYSNY